MSVPCRPQPSQKGLGDRWLASPANSQVRRDNSGWWQKLPYCRHRTVTATPADRCPLRLDPASEGASRNRCLRKDRRLRDRPEDAFLASQTIAPGRRLTFHGNGNTVLALSIPPTPAPDEAGTWARRVGKGGEAWQLGGGLQEAEVGNSMYQATCTGKACQSAPQSPDARVAVFTQEVSFQVGIGHSRFEQ